MPHISYISSHSINVHRTGDFSLFHLSGENARPFLDIISYGAPVVLQIFHRIKVKAV